MQAMTTAEMQGISGGAYIKQCANCNKRFKSGFLFLIHTWLCWRRR